MCGRYYLDPDDRDDDLTAILAALNRSTVPAELKTSGEIFPSDVVPVIANSRQLTPRPFAMRWGYSFPGDRPVINARVETAADKPLFRDGMKQRRCLIPASHYFEWARQPGQRTKYALRPAQRGTVYLAGIYHLENHDGIIVPAFTILTREATPEIAFIHPRMPVMLPRNVCADWLNPQMNAQELVANALTSMAFQPAV